MKQEESALYRTPLESSCWQQLIGTLGNGLAKLDPQSVGSLVQRISEGIRWLDAPMKSYCEHTCPSCEDPCCRGTEIFFNRADLLYLVARGDTIPPGQTRSQASEPCRYLAVDGCRLPRQIRPYVCVWFLCDAQMRLFQEEPASFQRLFIKTLGDIRICRVMLEHLYEECLAS